MSNSNEKWWERVPRIIGGWGFAILVFLRFPFPEAQLVDGTPVRVDPGVVSWGIYVGLIAFSIGVAHSTVTGIVLGQIGRAWAFARRGGKERRNSEAGLEAPSAPSDPAVTEDRRRRQR
ncbi:hypothetical protein LCGC14_0930060 [marine sediment metagenome]|uniref:Uncharacterized protein n=1 Tax=marine sediment metagenome TaxID=412755 RepID=A0A0F9R6Q6_9ZZZZ